MNLDFIFTALYATLMSWTDQSLRRPVVYREIEMRLKRSLHATIEKPVLAMPTRPLGLAERSIVERALAEVASDWSVELDGICADQASLVLLPEGGDDAMGPSFIISRESFGFRLDQLHWDVMQEIGTFGALADAVAAVQLRLTFTGLASSGSHTLH